MAYKLVQKSSVQKAIQEAMKKREKRTEITQDVVLAELAKIGFASITDYLEYKTVLRKVGHSDDGEPQYDWAMIVNTFDSSETDGSPIQEVSISKDGTFKFKLHSKPQALEMIARHLGMFKDKIEISGEMKVNPLVGLTEAELRRLAAYDCGSETGDSTSGTD